MPNSGPYSRFYWKFRDEFADIYTDKETFGWWMTLLSIADGSHPSAGELPRRISKRCLSKLVDAELVDLCPGDRFTVKGVAKERERRSEAGRVGGLASGRSRNPERSFNGRSPDIEPRRDETRKEEQRRVEPSNAPAGAEKHGSKNETDEERYARYLALRDDPSKSADIRAAADHAVKAYEAVHRVN